MLDSKNYVWCVTLHFEVLYSFCGVYNTVVTHSVLLKIKILTILVNHSKRVKMHKVYLSVLFIFLSTHYFYSLSITMYVVITSLLYIISKEPPDKHDQKTLLVVTCYL